MLRSSKEVSTRSITHYARNSLAFGIDSELRMTPADLLDACADLYFGFNSDNFKASEDDAKDDDPCVPQ